MLQTINQLKSKQRFKSHKLKSQTNTQSARIQQYIWINPYLHTSQQSEKNPTNPQTISQEINKPYHDKYRQVKSTRNKYFIDHSKNLNIKFYRSIMSVNQSQQSNQPQNNFHIDQDEQGNPAIFIPVWQNDESHQNQSYIQQKQQQIRMYKSKIHHLQKHIQEYDRNFQNLYAALNQATHSEKLIKKELIQTRTVFSQLKIQKESLAMHNQILGDKVKQINLAQVEDKSIIECLQQDNKLLKKRNQQLISMLEQQQQHFTIKPNPEPRSLKPQQIQKYQASLSILQNQLAQQKRQKSRLQKALKDYEMVASQREQELQVVARELEDMRQKMVAGKKDLQRMEGENVKLKALVEDLQAKMREVEDKGQQVINEKQKHQGVVKKLRDKIKELEQTLADQTNQMQSTKQQISSLQQKLKLQKDKLTSTQKQKRTLEQELTRIKQQFSSIVQQKDQQISRLSTQLSQSQLTVQQMMKKLQRFQEDSSKIGSQHNHSQELKELEQKCQQFEKMLENEQNELSKEKKKSKKLQAKISETQLEINSLANDKQLLLEELNQLKSARKPISPLQQRQKIPSDDRQIKNLQGLLKQKQKQVNTAKQTIIQLQKQLQRTRQQLQQSKQQLQHARQQLGHKQSQMNQVQRQLISSKQKINSLQQKCKRLEKASSQLSFSKRQVEQSVRECDSCEQLQNRLQEMQSVNEEMSEKLGESEKQVKQKEQESKKLMKQVEKLMKQADKHKKQADKHKKQNQKMGKSLKQAQQQLNQLHQQLQHIKEQLQRHKEQLTGAIQQKQQIEEQQSEMKAKLKQMNESMVSANKQLAVMKNKQKDKQAKYKEQIKRRDQQIKRRDQQIKERELKINRQEQDIQNLMEKVDDLQKYIHENASLKDIINSLKKQVVEVRNKLLQVQPQLDKKQAQLNKKQEQIQSLKETLNNNRTSQITHTNITADHNLCKSTQSRLTQQIKSLETQLSLANKQLTETNRLLQEQYDKQSEMKSQLDQMQRQLNELKRQLNEARSSETRNYKQVGKKTDHSVCNAEIQALKIKMQGLGVQLEQSQEQLKIMTSKGKEHDEVREALRIQITQLEKQNKQLKQQIQTNKQNLNRQPLNNSASKGLSETDYQMNYQNQLQKLRRLLISSKSKPQPQRYPQTYPQRYLQPSTIPQKPSLTINPSYNSRQSSPYDKMSCKSKSQEEQMIHGYYEQQIRKILSQLQSIKVQNAKLREYILRLQGQVSLVDTRHQCHNCRILQDSIIQYQQKITLLQMQLTQLRQQVYELRCLNQQYAEHQSLRQTRIHHHNSIELSELVREIDLYKSEIRRFQKLLNEQERFYQTKLVSKDEEIKLLHIRIQSVRLGKQSDALLKQRETIRFSKQREAHTHSLINSPSLEKQIHIQRATYGLRKGKTLNKTYLVGIRDSIEKRQA